MNALSSFAAPLGRILLALIFIMSGYAKIGGYDGTAGYMEAMGVPSALLPLVIVTELGLGLLLALGYQTRLAALGLAGFTALAAFLFHFNLADQMQSILFWKNVAITGGLLVVFAQGAGAYALENKVRPILKLA